ncbi:MAG TPA: 50S ribosomal protein L1 [Erysipelotrichaceae bacterium]|nr:50S ribosomal protein L1 [Erysipelotrichaceae bacterium]
MAKRRGKKYQEAFDKFDREKYYEFSEAIALVKELATANFDETVEVSFNLNVDPRHADQQIRGAMVLPHGTGKSQKILVITQGEKEQEAKDAGADHVGGKELLEDISKGWDDFDIIVATPDMMGELGKLGRVLGPRGLMPNPRTGTVTMDIAKAVEEIKKGKIEYRVDKSGNLAVAIGKASFTDVQLLENLKSINEVITAARPAAVRGRYIKNLVLSSTMSPGIKLLID